MLQVNNIKLLEVKVQFNRFPRVIMIQLG